MGMPKEHTTRHACDKTQFEEMVDAICTTNFQWSRQRKDTMICKFFLSTVFLWSMMISDSDSFLVRPNILHRRHYETLPFRSLSPIGVARYGPPLTPPPGQHPYNKSSNSTTTESDLESVILQQQKVAFQQLIDDVLSASEPEHIPRILANNVELLLSLRNNNHGTQEAIESILQEAASKMQTTDEEHNGSNSHYNQTLQVVDMILSFTEDFVQEAQTMDSRNKNLLGKIIKAMMKKQNGIMEENTLVEQVSYSSSSLSREEALDQLLQDEKVNFTPGFLRHIEGECERITKAPQMTRESAKMLELLRIIQTRVLEELGREMGEATLVLGQLMGYDCNDELLGVLDAGLTVQGRDFALEMASLTKEALDGFLRLPGGVDPELVDRVTIIDTRLQEFLTETDEFQ